MKAVSRFISSAVLLVLTGGVVLAAKKAPALFQAWYPRFSQWILGILGGVSSVTVLPLWEVGVADRYPEGFHRRGALCRHGLLRRAAGCAGAGNDPGGGRQGAAGIL